MTPNEKLDALIEKGGVMGIFAGRSGVPGKQRFVTIRGANQVTLAEGKGATTDEALSNALASLALKRGGMPC